MSSLLNISKTNKKMISKIMALKKFKTHFKQSKQHEKHQQEYGNICGKKQKQKKRMISVDFAKKIKPYLVTSKNSLSCLFTYSLLSVKYSKFVACNIVIKNLYRQTDQRKILIFRFFYENDECK